MFTPSDAMISLMSCGCTPSTVKVIGSGILGLNYTHAAAKKIGPKQARVMHRVFCGVTGLGMAMHIFAVKQPKE